ncbi:hypothetical protein [Sphingobium sp. CCH11-B1]|uniref:hypothetical protein n=1 Tax=Sphingobium sp. CCH11-B1 TaxID=1768781 RepID=UPI0018D24562|nr:hypothetical protein [Sphingobium sp. CCH11-B1]
MVTLATISPRMMVASSTFKGRVKLHGRSGLEDKTMADLAERGVPFRYEEVRVSYEKPASSHKYTPDFILPNGVIVETKGLFDSDDRKKHELIRKQHPALDIRFVFSRSASPIRKGSKTTYGSWCAKLGIPYADKAIPQAWIDEPDDPARHAAISNASA